MVIPKFGNSRGGFSLERGVIQSQITRIYNTNNFLVSYDIFCRINIHFQYKFEALFYLTPYSIKIKMQGFLAEGDTFLKFYHRRGRPVKQGASSKGQIEPLQ